MPANQSTARLLNQKEIIKSLLVQGDQSRADLSKRLGLSKPAVAENVEGLIQRGLIREIGEGVVNKKGGRRPRMLSFHRTHCYLAAIDLSQDIPRLALGDLTGAILRDAPVEGLVGAETDAERWQSAVVGGITALLEQSGAGADQLGVIAVTGEDHPHCRWSHLPVNPALASAFNCPIIHCNSVYAAAYAEAKLGCGKHYDKQIYVYLGDIVSAGIVLDGQLYLGANHVAGSLNAFTGPHLADGETLSDIVTTDAFLGRIRLDIQSGQAPENIQRQFPVPQEPRMEQVIQLYENRDRYITGKILAMGRELGYALNSIASFLDLDLIVLGGEYGPFLGALRREIQMVLHRFVPHPPVILSTQLEQEATLCGSLLFARNHLFYRMQL